MASKFFRPNRSHLIDEVNCRNLNDKMRVDDKITKQITSTSIWLGEDAWGEMKIINRKKQEGMN